MTKVVKAVRCMRVTIVTGYNNDWGDLMLGGPTLFGPHTLVVENEVPNFVREMNAYLKRTGKNRRVKEVCVEKAGLFPENEVLRGQAKVRKFKRFLAKKSNWPKE